MVILVGYMTNWTGKLLVEALYLHPNSNIARIMCYPGLGEAAYGKKGWLCVQWFHKWTLFGVCTIFLIIAAKFLMEAIGGAGEGLFADQFSNNEAFTNPHLLQLLCCALEDLHIDYLSPVLALIWLFSKIKSNRAQFLKHGVVSVANKRMKFRSNILKKKLKKGIGKRTKIDQQTHVCLTMLANICFE